MLTKKVAAIITAATRLCSKCGATVILAVTDGETICKCGEVIVHDVKNDADTINGGTTHETAEFAAGDSSTESDDSK